MAPPGSAPKGPVVPTSTRVSASRGRAAGPETERVISVFGSNARGGTWEPAERVEATTVFGSVTLDLREASLYDVTHVQCFCLFGNVEVRVPADVDVDANGIGIFGAFEERRRQGGGGRVVRAIGRALRGEPAEAELPDEPAEEPPLLEVRGFALFGNVTVKIG